MCAWHSCSVGVSFCKYGNVWKFIHGIDKWLIIDVYVTICVLKWSSLQHVPGCRQIPNLRSVLWQTRAKLIRTLKIHKNQAVPPRYFQVFPPSLCGPWFIPSLRRWREFLWYQRHLADSPCPGVSGVEHYGSYGASVWHDMVMDHDGSKFDDLWVPWLSTTIFCKRYQYIDIKCWWWIIMWPCPVQNI